MFRHFQSACWNKPQLTVDQRSDFNAQMGKNNVFISGQALLLNTAKAQFIYSQVYLIKKKKRFRLSVSLWLCLCASVTSPFLNTLTPRASLPASYNSWDGTSYIIHGMSLQVGGIYIDCLLQSQCFLYNYSSQFWTCVNYCVKCCETIRLFTHNLASVIDGNITRSFCFTWFKSYFDKCSSI